MENEDEMTDGKAETKKAHTVRHKDGGTVTINNYIRSKAIKLMCSECMGFDENPKNCTDNRCPLFPFRGLLRANRTRNEKAEENG